MYLIKFSTANFTDVVLTVFTGEDVSHTVYSVSNVGKPTCMTAQMDRQMGSVLSSEKSNADCDRTTFFLEPHLKKFCLFPLF
jgi:hypothetical protein